MKTRFQYRFQYRSREGVRWTDWLNGGDDINKAKEMSKKTDKATHLKHEFREC